MLSFFLRTRRAFQELSFTLYKHSLSMVREVRFLGIKYLTWVPHFKSLYHACQSLLDFLRYLSHNSFDADRTTFLRLCLVIVCSKLD